MMENTLLSQIFNLGFPAIIAVLIFFAYRDQNKALLEAVRNQTKVVSDFQAIQTQTVNDLNDHDDQAKVIGDCVGQLAVTVSRVDVRTIRIEEALKKHDNNVKVLLKQPENKEE